MNKLGLSWFSIKKTKTRIHIAIKPIENPDAKQTLHESSVPHRSNNVAMTWPCPKNTRVYVWRPSYNQYH